MILTIDEAQKISTELKQSYIQAVVGEGLDKIHMYVYSIDPLISVCNCYRNNFDKQALKVASQLLAQYKNVEVKLGGPATSH